MENGLIVKIYKIDYSFLIRNYLNPELWDKKWTLFIYKNYEISLNIYRICTKDKKIEFEIELKNINNSSQSVKYITTCSLKIEDLTFMKRQINSTIYSCIVSFERLHLITEADEYTELTEQMWEERNRLERYANEFLDECNVTSDACREAYVDAYVEENEQIYDLRDKWVDEQVYRFYPDFYLVFLNTLEDDPKKEIRTEEITKKLSDDELETVKQEIKDFQILFEDEENFEKELKSKLTEV